MITKKNQIIRQSLEMIATERRALKDGIDGHGWNKRVSQVILKKMEIMYHILDSLDDSLGSLDVSDSKRLSLMDVLLKDELSFDSLKKR